MAAPRKSTKPEATAAPEPQAPIETPAPKRFCLCRCGEEMTSKNGLFRPGHDAKAVGKLTRAVLAGEMTEGEALATIEPASSALKLKVSRAVTRAQTAAALKAALDKKAEAEAAPKPEAEDAK